MMMLIPVIATCTLILNIDIQGFLIFQKYMRTLESLDSCKDEVFSEVEQTIDEGYCDEKEKDTYYDRMKQIDEKIKALRNEALKDLDKYVFLSR